MKQYGHEWVSENWNNVTDTYMTCNLKFKSLVRDPDGLRGETPPHPLCFGLEAAITPPWWQQREESVVGVMEVLYDLLSPHPPPPGINVLYGWEFTSDGALCWPHHPLQDQVIPLSAAPKPLSDAACQDALYDAPWGAAWSPFSVWGGRDADRLSLPGCWRERTMINPLWCRHRDIWSSPPSPPGLGWSVGLVVPLLFRPKISYQLLSFCWCSQRGCSPGTSSPGESLPLGRLSLYCQRSGPPQLCLDDTWWWWRSLTWPHSHVCTLLCWWWGGMRCGWPPALPVVCP